MRQLKKNTGHDADGRDAVRQHADCFCDRRRFAGICIGRMEGPNQGAAQIVFIVI